MVATTPRTATLVLMVVFVVGAAAAFAVVILASPTTVPVTFRETGLPEGRPWSVSVDNTTYTSSKETVTVQLLPDSYRFTVRLANGTDYVPYPASGRVAVGTAGVSVSIDFVRSHANVTIRETGLPDGDLWTIAEGSEYYNSNTTSLSVTEADGNHSLRVLVTLTHALNDIGPVWVDDDLYLSNVSRLNVSVNGTDASLSIRFSLLLAMNYTMFNVPVFPNETGLGAPAYYYRALTFTRYTTVNYSFHGGPYGITPFPNVTAYLMTPDEFHAFTTTGNASQYVATSGNVSEGNWSMNFDSGTWYFFLTGQSVDEYGSAGYSYGIMFPGEVTYFS